MKTMKKMATAACIIGMSMITGQAMAGHGGGSCNCRANLNPNACPMMCVDICAGEPVTISGTVVDAGVSTAQGMRIDTGSEVVTVYGIGPIRYWNSLEIARPDVGDQVEIDANTVTFSDGTKKDIAITVTIGDVQVDLRDDDCIPLWRGGRDGQALNLSSMTSDYSLMAQGKGYGPGDGTGTGTGPGDGTGNGPGTGDCLG